MDNPKEPSLYDQLIQFNENLLQESETLIAKDQILLVGYNEILNVLKKNGPQETCNRIYDIIKVTFQKYKEICHPCPTKTP